MIYLLTVKNPSGRPLTLECSNCVELSYKFAAYSAREARDATNRMLMSLHSVDRTIWTQMDKARNDLWTHDYESDYTHTFSNIEISCKEQA